MDFGFVKVAAAVPEVRVADCVFNAGRIVSLMLRAAERGAALVAFPELSLTGYTCGDLFGQQTLAEEARRALALVVERTRECGAAGVVGMPLAVGHSLCNAAVVFGGGRVLGVVPKSWVPGYGEFYEGRWFVSGREMAEREVVLCGQRVPFGTDLLFGEGDLRFGVEVCEDLWVPVPPSSHEALGGAVLLVNISASDELAGKHAYLRGLVCQQSARTLSAYLYVSAGWGESTTDLVFAGNVLAAENGTMLCESERFSLHEQLLVTEVDAGRLVELRRRTNTFGGAERMFREVEVALRRPDYTGAEGEDFGRRVDPLPFVPSGPEREERCTEVFSIQVLGLARRLVHTKARSAVVGISGGLDSTLALLVTVAAFDRLGWDRKGVVGVTMPGFGTTGRTYRNALGLMEALGVTVREIPIGEACTLHFRDIGLDPSDRGVTYENAQARERTQILMDVANLTGGLVVGTGDLSELALGWATYNGDQMSMYGVNAGVPKTLVRHLVEWAAGREDERVRALLLDVVDTPVSPELIPPSDDGAVVQRTEELVGPYELHDFFLYHFLRFGFRPAKIFFLARKAFAGRYDAETIRGWMRTFFRRFFAQQFKRSAMPDGPKVGSVGLSPRGDWRMPSDASAEAWIRETDTM